MVSLKEGYLAAFDTGDEAYPYRLLSGGWFAGRAEAVLGCVADMRQRALEGDAGYCSLNSYVIRHERWNEEGSLLEPEVLDSWRADEVESDILPDAPNVGDSIVFTINGWRRMGRITHVQASFARGYFVVTEFNKNGYLSRDRRRQHYFHIRNLGYDAKREPLTNERIVHVYRRMVIGTLEGEPYMYGGCCVESVRMVDVV